ncbi:MAG: hypothetical protein DRH04_04500, partial [Deltaproteobacteria bacterium]
ELSVDNGASWQTIAAGQGMDRFGRGAFTWTAGPETSGNTALIRVSANTALNSSDVSDRAFMVSNNDHEYYINDDSLTGDEFTTAPGDNANSGKSADAPMATLSALLRAYDLDAGDVVYVDTGSYKVLTNIILDAEDSGVEIRGPEEIGHQALFDRAINENYAQNSRVFVLDNTSDITLSHLALTGAYYGISQTNNSVNTNITIDHCEIFANDNNGVSLGYHSTDITLTDNIVHDNGSYGLSLSGARTTVSGGEVYANANTGIYLNGPDSLIEGVEVYANSVYGIYAAGTNNSVRDNLVHDNVNTGIMGGGDTLISDNRVYGHNGNNIAGIYAYKTVENNIVYNNFYGISGGGDISGNRVYGNTNSGIYLNNLAGEIRNNIVYSNPIGINFDSSYYGAKNGWISANLIYANTNQALLISDGAAVEVTGNTIYQSAGDAVSLTGTIGATRVADNILWVDAGATINVESSAQAGFSSDYNLFFLGSETAAIGRWAGVEQSDLTAWQAASSQDAGSLVDDPLFLDIDGADNVFAGPGSAEGSGEDDNFNLRRHSPAIDRASAYDAPLTDLLGRPRHDDPDTVNSGIGWDDFTAADTGADSFVMPDAADARGWHSSNYSWDYTLPFTFSFYGTDYTSVKVSSGGFLHFAGPDSTNNYSHNSLDELQRNVRIAPLWENITTYNSDSTFDIYIDESTADQATITWKGKINVWTGSEVNFSVTLFADGTFRFDYGNGNDDLTPTVGISAGNGFIYELASYDGQANLANVNSLLWTPHEGLTYYDMGAFEFQGASNDITPPMVTAIPTLPDAGGSTALAFSSILIDFSEPLDGISARSIANYDLREAGGDGIFDTTDDQVIDVTPVYSFRETSMTLGLLDGALADGDYRLTLSGTKAIYDTAGNPLDGNSDGTGGDDFIRLFTIDRSANTAPVADEQDVNVEEDGSAVITLTGSDADGDPLAFGIESNPAHGILSDFDVVNHTVTYTPDPDFNGPDSFTFQVDDGKLGTDIGIVSLTVNPVNDQPVADAVNVTLDENSAIVIILGGSDLETASADLTYDIVDSPTHGSLTQQSNDSWLYTPGTDYFGLDSFTYTVTDNGDPAGSPANSLTSTAATVAITVNQVSVPPEIDPIADITVAEGSEINFTVTGSVDAGNIGWSLGSGSPAGAAINPASGLFTWTPADGDDELTITVIATADSGLSAQTDFTVTVNNVAPTLTISGAVNGYKGEPYTLNLASSDPGDDGISDWTIDWGDGTVEEITGNPDTASHVYQDASYLDGDFDQDGDVDGTDMARFANNYGKPDPDLTCDLDGDGDVDNDDLNLFAINYAKIGMGSYTITATATDEDGSYSAGSLAVTVENILVIDPVSNVAVNEGEDLHFTVAVSGFAGNITWSLEPGSPAGATIDAGSGLFDWTPADGDVQQVFTVNAVADNGLSGQADFTVMVNNVAPTLTISGDENVAEGVPYELHLAASDPGDDTISDWTVNWGDGTIDHWAGDATIATHQFTPLAYRGDLDGDGDVDGTDMAVFADQYNQTGENLSADLDHDGDVDDDDLAIFSASYANIGYDAYTVTATATDEDGTWSANSIQVTDPPTAAGSDESLPPDDAEPPADTTVQAEEDEDPVDMLPEKPVSPIDAGRPKKHHHKHKTPHRQENALAGSGNTIFFTSRLDDLRAKAETTARQQSQWSHRFWDSRQFAAGPEKAEAEV